MASTTQGKDVANLEVEAKETLRSKTLLQKAIWRIARDKLTLTSMAVILFMAVVSYAAPLIVKITDIDYNNNDLYNNELPLMSRVADSDTTVLMHLTETGEYRRPFIGHGEAATAVTFSPDGDHFITGSEVGEIRLWHVPTGRNKRNFILHDDRVNALAFNSTGDKFVSASEDGTSKLWITEKELPKDPDDPLLVFDHPEAVNGVAMSSDDALVLTGSDDTIARLWDAESGELVRYLEGHTGAVTSVAFSSDASVLATASEDNSIRIWNTNSGEVLFTLTVSNSVNSVAFNESGSTVLVSGGDTAQLVDVESGEVLQTFAGHSDTVNSAVFSADYSQVVTGSTDGTAKVWDVNSGEATITFDDFDYAVNQVAISADGEAVFTGTDGRERLYLLGTDSSGRDHLSRLLYGGQVSLRIGFLAALGAITIGISVGVVAGYFGGIFDDVIMWFITTLDSIPSLFLLLILSAVLSPNDTTLIMILVVLGWTGATRIVRGETFSLREREFVLAARALGASSPRIMFLHIVPNVISILLIVMARSIGNLILAESALSFLGFGVKPPTPTWGNMLSGDLGILREAPHLVIIPGLLISITVLCLFIIGDGLRDAFDPKLSD